MISGFVVLFAALTTATWIDVPFTRQEKDGCGSASVWMVMKYWGKSPSSPEEIHRILYSSEAGGIFASDLERFLATHGFSTTSFTGEWGDLVENVAKGRPLIVSIEANSRGTPLHYVLITGVDEAQGVVLLNDPARRKLFPMERSDFERQWEAMKRWTLLAVPEGSALPAPPAPSIADADRVFDPSLEEATTAFRAGDYAKAKRLLRPTPSGDSAVNPLRNEFLATLFFLEDNLEAALKYWNRNGSPRVREVRLDFDTRWNPVLLDQTVGISRASVLENANFRLAEKRLDATGAFSNHTFDLTPVGSSQEFDLSLRASERTRWNLLGALRGLPYQSVAPEFTNLRGRGINIALLWRWDSDKRRVAADVSGPASMSVRYKVGVDARNELWDRNGVTTPVQRDELHLGLQGVATHRWTWSSGALIVRRPSGMALKYDGGMTYDLLRIPERRVALTTDLHGQFGRTFSDTRRILRAQTGFELSWKPQATGNDYESRTKVRTGRIWGNPFLDELFSIGVDRDENLWLRGHSTVRNGRKGAGLLGRRYVLWNSEVSKRVFEVAFVKTSIVPFIDVARVGSVFVDAGAELRISVASLFKFSISAGRDLRAGRTVVFTNLTR